MVFVSEEYISAVLEYLKESKRRYYDSKHILPKVNERFNTSISPYSMRLVTFELKKKGILLPYTKSVYKVNYSLLSEI
jgi:hypothetical protein